MQGRNWLPKTGWASSNAAPSILPKPAWAIANPAHPPLTPLPMKDLAFIVQHICVTKSIFSLTQVKIIQKQPNSAFKTRLITCIQILSVFS